jgi:hypothetical protein
MAITFSHSLYCAPVAMLEGRSGGVMNLVC